MATPFVLRQPVYKGELKTYGGVTYEVLQTNEKPGIYPKAGASYRVVPETKSMEGVISLAKYGIVGGSEKDMLPSMRDLIKDLPRDTGTELEFGRGRLRFSKGLLFEGGSPLIKGIYRSTTLVFPSGQPGIELVGTHGGDQPMLQDLILEFEGNAKDGYKGIVRSDDEMDYAGHGIKSDCIFLGYRVTITRPSGCGVFVQADIYNKNKLGNGQNASGFYLHRPVVQQSGSTGFFIKGSDANAFVLDNPFCNDAGGWAVHDASFLGGTVSDPRFHKSRLGHIKISHQAAHPSLRGSYCEDDSPPNEFGGVVYAEGFFPNGYTRSAHATVIQGAKQDGLLLGKFSYDEEGQRIIDSTYAQPLFERMVNGVLKTGTSEQQGEAGCTEIFPPNVAPHGRRAQARAGFAVNYQYKGRKLEFTMSPRGGVNFTFKQDLPMLLTFEKGDTVSVDLAEDYEAHEFVCVQAGGGEGNPPAKWKALGHGRGTSDQRPGLHNKNYSNLDSDDFSAYVGWPYFNTDTNRQEFLDLKTMTWL